MSTTASFVGTPRTTFVQATAANTTRDGTGTIADVWTNSTERSRIEHIDITAAGTTTAGVIRLYLYDGTNTRLWKEILVTAITPSATVAVWNSSVNCSNLSALLIIPPSWKLRVSTHNAETFNVIAVGGDF